MRSEISPERNDERKTPARIEPSDASRASDEPRSMLIGMAVVAIRESASSAPPSGIVGGSSELASPAGTPVPASVAPKQPTMIATTADMERESFCAPPARSIAMQRGKRPRLIAVRTARRSPPPAAAAGGGGGAPAAQPPSASEGASPSESIITTPSIVPAKLLAW